MLAAAGVLKLVDEKVVNAIGKRDRRRGGETVVRLERILRNLSNFNKVDGGCLGKHNLQLSSGVAKERETGANDLPILIGIARRRQLAD